MLDEITVTQQSSVISVIFDGEPYLITFTGKIGIGWLGGAGVFFTESEDAQIIKVEYDHGGAERDRRRAGALAEAMPSAIPRPWWHGRWPVVQHTLRTGIDYMDDLVALETERCAKMAEDAHNILAAGILADGILDPKFQEIRRKHGKYIAEKIRSRK